MQPVQGYKMQMANLVLGRPLGALFFLEFPITVFIDPSKDCLIF